MKRVTILVHNAKGKLIRTCQEYYLGPIGTRQRAHNDAIATVKSRFERSGQFGLTYTVKRY